jgi:hypothetical protein
MGRVSTETTSEEFNSLHNTVELFSKGLSSLAGTYEEALGQMNLESVDFSNWNDAVKVKLENICDSLKTAKSTISSDISGGSFSRLKTCAESLETLLKDCYDKKVSIDADMETLSTTPKKISKDITPPGNIIDPATGETRPRMKETIQQTNPAYTNLKNSIDTAVEELDNMIIDCNALFTELETIEFNSSTSSEAVAPSTSETSSETTSDSEYPEGHTVTAREALDALGYNYIDVYDESTTYYAVDVDLGSGQMTYYFNSEESYQNFMREREFRQQLANAANNGQELTINYDGTDITLEAEHNIPSVGEPTYLSTPYSQFGINVVSDDAGWDNNNGDYKFYDSDGESYSVSDILLHASI